MDFKEIFSVTLILFSVIDILGTIPFIIQLQKRFTKWKAGRITSVSGLLLFTYFLVGEQILNMFGVDVSSFAIAGGLIMFLLGLEMLLNIEIFKHDPNNQMESPVVPLAFPLIAGAGSMTTLISLRTLYSRNSIVIGILINLAVVYLVLKNTKTIDRYLGKAGNLILKKFFGTILIAMAIKLFKQNWTGI